MATTDKILKSYKSAMENALSHIEGSRAGQTIIGGTKNSLASDVNSGATIYNLTQGARDTMMSTYVSDSANSLKQARQALAQLEREGASAYEIENQQTVVNSLQRQYDAMSMVGAVQRGATQATYRLADDIKDSASASIAKAKDGLGTVGKTAVDVGAALTEMGLDKVKSTLLIGGLGPNYESDDMLKQLADTLKLAPLAARSYGNNSQAARRDGADAKSSALYGLSTAISDAYIEDTLDGLAGAYGIGRWEKKIRDAFYKFRQTPASQKIFDFALANIGEGAESLAGGIIRQALKTLYNRKDSIENISEIDIQQTFHNALADVFISSYKNFKRGS